MKKLAIMMIKFYQKNISKIFWSKGVRCKFYPTCSEYTKEAIEEYGTLKGIVLGIKRIIKCNPFSKGGYDPVENKNKKIIK